MQTYFIRSHDEIYKMLLQLVKLPNFTVHGYLGGSRVQS